MRQRLLEAIWLALTIAYFIVVGFSLGRAWSDTFTIAGLIVVVIGWVLIGTRRYALRRDFERRRR